MAEACLEDLNITLLACEMRASLVVQRVKHLPTIWETRVQSLGREDPLEKELAIHSSTLVLKISWTEKPGRLESMGSQRVGHNWVTWLTYLQEPEIKLPTSAGGGDLVAKSCPTLATPWTVPARLLRPWDSPGKNTGVGCHFLLQGIFLTQGSNSHLSSLLHQQGIHYHLCYLGSPNISIQLLCSRFF